MDKQAQFQAELNTLFDKMTMLDQAGFKKELPDYKPAEVHTVEFIGKHHHANVTMIANTLYVTRGAVSKMSKRLIKKDLIESFQTEDNQKEIYFRLTTKGQEVFNIHERLTKRVRQRDAEVFEQNSDQVVTVLDFLQKYNNFLDKQLEKNDEEV